jgi:hypothetical protein
MRILALTPDQVFGVISPPPGSQSFTGDPVAGLGNILVVSIQFLIIIAAIFVLFYLLIGAFMWVTSGGDDDALQKARLQMTNAVWGFLMIFVALAVFGLITGDVLGIMKKDPAGGWIFKIPSISGSGPGTACTSGSVCDSGVCNLSLVKGKVVGKCQ